MIWNILIAMSVIAETPNNSAIEPQTMDLQSTECTLNKAKEALKQFSDFPPLPTRKESKQREKARAMTVLDDTTIVRTAAATSAWGQPRSAVGHHGPQLKSVCPWCGLQISEVLQSRADSNLHAASLAARRSDHGTILVIPCSTMYMYIVFTIYLEMILVLS